jgi:catechol 2,3-dioxygenase-like lactoylglutathione lyase family enzyme
MVSTSEPAPSGVGIVEFNHVALLVSDIEASKRWYRDVLGWKEIFANRMPATLGDLNGFTGSGGDIAMGEICGVRVELVAMDTESALQPWSRNDRYGLFLMSVRVGDVDAIRARCTALGVPIVREGTIGASGGSAA